MYRILMINYYWNDEYLNGIISGMNSLMEAEDIRLDVLNAEAVELESLYQTMEYNIYTLVNESKYDGLILAVSGDRGLSPQRDSVIDEFERAGKPVVSIDKKIRNFPYVGIDNKQSMYEMVEHLIKVHGCKTFAYVGGPGSNQENLDRYAGYCAAIEDNGLEVNKEYVGHYSFLEPDGYEAYKSFRRKMLPIPDAVVCANDMMAHGFSRASQEEGSVSPKDYILVGFDNIGMCQKYMPSITSVNRNWEMLGRESLKTIIRMICGKTVEGKISISGRLQLNESCGCWKDRDLPNELIKMIWENQINDIKQEADRITRQGMCICNTLDEIQSSINEYRQKLSIPPICVSLNQDFARINGKIHKIPYTQDMVMITNEEIINVSKKKDIIPESWKDKEGRIFFFSPLHYGGDSQGYITYPYDKNHFNMQWYHSLIESITMAVENIRQKSTLDDMNKKLQMLYVKDALTGLYNRFGFTTLSGKLFSECRGKVYIVYADIDNLKTMNDEYGHENGDLLIKGMADCLRNVFTDTDIHVRMGGDEFLVMGKFSSEEWLFDKEQELEAAMEKYSIEKNLPLKLEASIGHSFNIAPPKDTELTRLLKSADSSMYEAKKERKRNRVR